MSARTPSGIPDKVSLTPERIADKRAFREIVRGCGGLEAAELNCRVGKSQLARYYDETLEEFAPLDVVADLEPLARGRAGWPHVTRHRARDLGFTLLDTPVVDNVTCDGLHEALTSAMRESGEASVGVLQALADRTVTKDEAKANLAACMEAAEAHLRMHAILKRISEEC
jgi:hypothetical protein